MTLVSKKGRQDDFYKLKIVRKNGINPEKRTIQLLQGALRRRLREVVFCEKLIQTGARYSGYPAGFFDIASGECNEILQVLFFQGLPKLSQPWEAAI